MSPTSIACKSSHPCSKPLILKPHIQNNQLVQNENPRLKNQKTFPIEENRKESKGEWNFIEALTNPSYKYKELCDQPEQVYVHPQAKRSTSLSTTSLEMCTECLGNETGNNIDPNADDFPILEKKSFRRMKKPKKNKQSNIIFPPPLPSISGSDGVQVKTHREDGRLVIKAYRNFSSCVSCFEAERYNGRLRLSFVKNDTHEMNGKEEVVRDENEGEFSRHLWGEEWSPTSRCNGDGKRLPSLPFCVAIS